MRFVDSNVFVYHIAADPRYGETAARILSRIEQGEEAATSTLVINQVVSYLKWKRAANSIPRFIEFLQSLPSLAKAETSFTDFVEAKRRSGQKWDAFDDFVIARQMERLNIEEIYSNDSDFDRIEHIKRVFE
jgi:predicted nucleic acid-binding protein